MSTCSNCGEAHDDVDVFCENCGLDFLTGSLPHPQDAVTSIGAARRADEGSADLANTRSERQPIGVTVTIRVDQAYYQRMDTGSVLELPDPMPDAMMVPLVAETVLVGRARPSKGQFPDIDLGADPAVSSRHAVLKRSDGQWTITDLGSMNGTYIGASTVQILADTPVPLSLGTPVYLGAWTRLDLS